LERGTDNGDKDDRLFLISMIELSIQKQSTNQNWEKWEGEIAERKKGGQWRKGKTDKSGVLIKFNFKKINLFYKNRKKIRKYTLNTKLTKRHCYWGLSRSRRFYILTYTMKYTSKSIAMRCGSVIDTFFNFKTKLRLLGYGWWSFLLYERMREKKKKKKRIAEWIEKLCGREGYNTGLYISIRYKYR